MDAISNNEAQVTRQPEAEIAQELQTDQDSSEHGSGLDAWEREGLQILSEIEKTQAKWTKEDKGRVVKKEVTEELSGLESGGTQKISYSLSMYLLGGIKNAHSSLGSVENRALKTLGVGLLVVPSVLVGVVALVEAVVRPILGILPLLASSIGQYVNKLRAKNFPKKIQDLNQYISTLEKLSEGNKEALSKDLAAQHRLETFIHRLRMGYSVNAVIRMNRNDEIFQHNSGSPPRADGMNFNNFLVGVREVRDAYQASVKINNEKVANTEKRIDAIVRNSFRFFPAFLRESASHAE